MGGPAAPAWERHTTSDGVASVECPGKRDSKEENIVANGLSVRQVSLVYNVPLKEINVILSVSPIESDALNISVAERIVAMKEYFRQQGCSNIHDSPMQLGVAPGYAIEADRGKIRSRMRVAVVAGKLYRVVVTSAGSHPDDAIINRCLESFRIERNSNM
jgi:hypothetical protein